MGFLSTILGILGFCIGIIIGLCLGFYCYIFKEPLQVKDPEIRPIYEYNSSSLSDILPEIPLWMKNPDYERIDWLNKFIHEMWPYLNKAVCGIISSTTKPIFAEYIGKFQIKSIDFQSLDLGTLPPTVHGVKVYETKEKELIFEPVVKWAGNPSITVVLRLLFLRITVELLDLQAFASPRIILKPLVPSFPCFANIVVSLMEKPHVDFGLKLLGGDLMAVPGLYRYVQENIKKQVASLYLWPRSLEIPILDESVGAVKKPVGVLHVKVIRAEKLLKMDILGKSDPYVKLRLSGERLPSKKTSIKMKNLNPVWNEEFKLIVKDLVSQSLELEVYDWEKVGTHDFLGMQVIPLRSLVPNESQGFTLDLLKNTNPDDPQNKKNRGRLVLEMTFIPFKDDNVSISRPIATSMQLRKPSAVGIPDESVLGAGLLQVTIQGAQDVEGKNHTNPYAVVRLKGEKKKTKVIKKTRDPSWNEEFEFMLEEAPLKEMIHIIVKSKRKGFHLRNKELLGHVNINLVDVIYNGRINEKYHLINSRNGVLHVEIRWKLLKLYPDPVPILFSGMVQAEKVKAFCLEKFNRTVAVFGSVSFS